jgi:hypothetical protein
MPSNRGQSRERIAGERTRSVHCWISAQRSQPDARFLGRGRKLRWRRDNHRSGIRDLRARRPSRRTSHKTDGQDRARAHDNQDSEPLRFQTRPGLCETARNSRCSVKRVIVFEQPGSAKRNWLAGVEPRQYFVSRMDVRCGPHRGVRFINERHDVSRAHVQSVRGKRAVAIHHKTRACRLLHDISSIRQRVQN